MRRVSMMVGISLGLACAGEQNGRNGSGAGGVDSLGTGGIADGDSDGDGGDGPGGDGQDGDGTAGDDDDDDGASPKFDLPEPDGEPSCGGGAGNGEGTLSHIWIANSSESTVSKINTQTMVEEGRYYARPAGGDPSRTSVSLSGNVAVANRNGGITKIWASPDNCQETNGVPGIQTSSGAGDILAWGEDECVAWHTPLAYSSNRPVAWTQGEWNDTTCRYENEKLWTSGANGPGTTQVLLLDGETGVVEQTVDLPQVGSSIGLYGGAVDGDGHFWGIETGGGRLVRVDRNTFQAQIWNGPGGSWYGMAVDSVGRPWFCAGGGASRFDPLAQTWQTLPSPGGNAWGGCMTDGDKTLWHCRQQDAMLVGIDTESLTVVQQIPLPQYAHGISIDFDGYVWAVGFVSSQAFRVDPQTGTIDTFNGLVGAYTYSDMTGFALSSAGVPEG